MPQSLASLLQSSSIVDDDEVLQAANAAISSNKNDIVAQQTKVVALLKLDRFDDAIRFIAGCGDSLASHCALEKAYALYKAGQIDEAAAIINDRGDHDPRFKHLAAQVAYRAERFQDAASIYNELVATDDDGDLRINAAAVSAQQEWLGHSSKIGGGIPETFELCYNVACFEIAKGNYDEATKLLQRAATLCKASEDLGDEDKQAELRPIWVQQAYVYARQGNTKEALDLYTLLGSTDDSDADFAAVAKNNHTLLSGNTGNPYIQQREMEAVVAAAKQAKLFSYQSLRLAKNVYVTDLNAHKATGVQSKTRKELAKETQPTIQSNYTLAGVINAAASVNQGTAQTAIRTLQNATTKRPLDVGLVLAIIQLQLDQHRAGAATATLESLFTRLDKIDTDEARDVRYSPGLVALSVSLMKKHGRQNAAKAEFSKAAKHWIARKDAATYSSSILSESGVQLMRSSDTDELKLAGAAFEKILERDSNCEIASAGLVASLAVLDSSTAAKHATELPAVEDLVDDTNVDALLKAGVAVLPGQAPTKKRNAADDGNSAAAKKHRRRRLPKNFVQGQTPDPERWLPLRDRSTYRPKNKKGKKKMADSTQGGPVKDEETLELVGGGGVKVEKASGGGAAKKKKKGKK